MKNNCIMFDRMCTKSDIYAQQCVECMKDEIKQYRAKVNSLMESCQKMSNELLIARDALQQLQSARDRSITKNNLVLYKCDGEACEHCNSYYCNYTDDIRHAINYDCHGTVFIEKTKQEA